MHHLGPSTVYWDASQLFYSHLTLHVRITHPRLNCVMDSALRRNRVGVLQRD
jgi:hypothetical protein